MADSFRQMQLFGLRWTIRVRCFFEDVWRSRLFGWFLLLSGSLAYVYWAYHIPSPGKSVAALAVIAAVMTFRGEINGVEKFFWMTVLFAFLFLELKSIDYDRARYAYEQKAIREEERESFSNLLNTERDGLRDILTQDQHHFERTLSNQVQIAGNQGERFNSLLGKQQNLFEQQNEMIQSLNGHLLPGSTPTPSLASLGCQNAKPTKDDYFLIMGGLTEIRNSFPLVVLRFKGKDMITISKSSEGSLVLSMDVRSSEGFIVARFDEQGFEVNPILLKRHPDKSTLIVEDQRGNQIIRAEYLNKRTFRLDGKLTLDGKTYVIPGLQLGGSCADHIGSHVDMNIGGI